MDEPGDFNIKSTEWYAQYFLPSLPVDTVSWKVTRVQFKAKSDGGATGESRVQLQTPTAGEIPSGVVLEEKTVFESALTSSYMLQEFTFSNVTDLAPDQGLCLVFKWIADATACKIYGDRNYDPPDGHLLKSTNSGGSWTVQSGDTLYYWIYGTVTTAGEPQIEATQYLAGATLTVQAGEDAEARVQTRVRALNAPEVAP
jgi:hypothetical protein